MLADPLASAAPVIGTMLIGVFFVLAMQILCHPTLLMLALADGLPHHFPPVSSLTFLLQSFPFTHLSRKMDSAPGALWFALRFEVRSLAKPEPSFEVQFRFKPSS